MMLGTDVFVPLVRRRRWRCALLTFSRVNRSTLFGHELRAGRSFTSPVGDGGGSVRQLQPRPFFLGASRRPPPSGSGASNKHTTRFGVGIVSGRREVQSAASPQERRWKRPLPHSPTGRPMTRAPRVPAPTRHPPSPAVVRSSGGCRGVRRCGFCCAWVFCAFPTNVDGARHPFHCRLDNVLLLPAATPRRDLNWPYLDGRARVVKLSVENCRHGHCGFPEMAGRHLSRRSHQGQARTSGRGRWPRRPRGRPWWRPGAPAPR